MTTRNSCLWIAAAAAFAFSACLAGAPIDDRIAAEPGTLTVIGFSGNPGTTYSAYAFWANVDLLSPDAVTEAILGGRHVASGSIEGIPEDEDSPVDEGSPEDSGEPEGDRNAFAMTISPENARMWADTGAFRVVLVNPYGYYIDPTNPKYRLATIGFTYGGATVGVGAFAPVLAPPLEPEPDEPGTFTINGFAGSFGDAVFVFPENVNLSTLAAIADAIMDDVHIATGVDLLGGNVFDMLAQGSPIQWTGSGTFQVVLMVIQTQEFHRATVTFTSGGATANFADFVRVQ